MTIAQRRSPGAQRGADPEQIATIALRSLLEELDTFPKPGLVSAVDRGSHADMDAALFGASAAAIAPFLVRLAAAGADQASMARLRLIGMDAETAMRAATGGVNTHRGAIFGLGLLCAAAGALGAGRGSLRLGALGACVRARWATDILDGPVLLHGHGAQARRAHGVGGAPGEAAAGFPSLYAAGLPVLRRTRARNPADPEAARIAACFALVAVLDDTNLLHRGGTEGLAFARAAAAAWVAAGGMQQPGARTRAAAVHRAFVTRRLSPGGAADLLAMTLFVDHFEQTS